MTDGGTAASRPWTAVFRRSRSRWHDFAVHRNEEGEVIYALDELGPYTNFSGPAYGDAQTVVWTIPHGEAEWSSGMFNPHGVWISELSTVLMLCEVLKLRPPRFATTQQVKEAHDLLAEIRREWKPPRASSNLDLVTPLHRAPNSP
jgi:hypothetical protein